MDKELNKTEFFNQLYGSREDSLLDNYYFNVGTYEGEDFVIFESNDSVRAVNAYINGYRGNLDLADLYREDSLIDELNKAESQLEKELKVNPSHCGTHCRLESRIKKLMNLSAYKRWLLNNEVEEKCIDDYGVSWGFSDEYDMCCHCQQEVVRTSADSYSWTAPLYVEAEGYVCDNCAGEYKEYILEEFCNVQKNIPDQFDTADLGLVKVNKDSYQNGMHPGMDDSPKPIIEALNAQGIDCWFKVEPSQFYCEFDVYVKDEDQEKAEEILDTTNTYQGYSGSENLKKCLDSCSLSVSSNEGIVYNNCDLSTGEVETRIISKEDFIEKGIK